MEWTGLSENLSEQDDEFRHHVQGYSDGTASGLSGEGTGDSLIATCHHHPHAEHKKLFRPEAILGIGYIFLPNDQIPTAVQSQGQRSQLVLHAQLLGLLCA